ncbi:MAG: RluA family pseudouridine synthase [Leptospiraceae bacterium]|nr:RluA family pseudouridine synthase [Leptospiraceae bacterium]MDW7975594.1 RluA family pseudouridine synthase [Leptospiraceae bacterium]
MLKFLYEDNHLLVVEKPIGMLSQSDRKNEYSLYDYLKDYLKKKKNKQNVYLAILHRLDRNTGGVMIFAKTSKSASRLSEQFRNHQIKKSYIVITSKIPITGTKGTMISYIKKIESKRTAILSNAMDPKAKYAELEYELWNEFEYNQKKYYKFLVHPKTGRFHQIRFQFAQHRAPLLGDRKYGKDTTTPFPALWAYEIQILHPTQKKELHFRTPPPEGWPFNLKIE